jgi:hypothetical protein
MEYIDLIEDARESTRAAEAGLRDIASHRVELRDIVRALCSLGWTLLTVTSAREVIVLREAASLKFGRWTEAAALEEARACVMRAQIAITSALCDLKRTQDPSDLPARAGRAADLLQQAADALKAAQWRVAAAIDRAWGLRGLTE